MKPAAKPTASTTASPTAGIPTPGHPGQDRVAEMLACVKASGLKMTPQRMAIVRELAGDPTHPTAQELFERLRPTLPTMSFATVYNTLDALAAAGLCASLSLSPGPARFDPNMEPHHHAVCDRCGLVRDVTMGDPERVPQTPPVPAGTSSQKPSGKMGGGEGSPAGFQIRAVELIYRGVCADCARQIAEGVTPPRSRRTAAADNGSREL